MKTGNWASVAAAFSVATLSSSVFAYTDIDALAGKALFSSVENKALETGKSTMSTLGKFILSSAIDSYVPGLSAALGLSGGPTSTQQILGAIAADGQKTRELVEDFWDWARSQDDLAIANDYQGMLKAIDTWYSLAPQYRIKNRDALAQIVQDCVYVCQQFGSGIDPNERVDRLQSYAHLMNFAISLQAELLELQTVGGAHERFAPGVGLDVWLASLSADALISLLNDVKTAQRTAVGNLLLRSSTGADSFLDYLQAVAQGTLPSGVKGQSDFVSARDSRFSPMESYLEGGKPSWVYYVGEDPRGNCISKEKYCTAFHIREVGVIGPNGQGVSVEYDNNGRYFYESGYEAYLEHKRIVLRQMITRGYGPVRVLADTWWSTWGIGWRPRNGLDDTLDRYVSSTGRSGGLILVKDYLTQGSMTPNETGVLGNFALTWGFDAVDVIKSAAWNNIDYLDDNSANITGDSSGRARQYTKWPADVHLNVMRDWPMTIDEVNAIYRGISVAKYNCISN